MGKGKKRHSDIGPYNNRLKCVVCGTKGGIKIVVNQENKDIIKRYLHSHTLMYMIYFDDSLDCYCQYCGDVRLYPLSKKLFADGVIKEI